MLRLPTLQGLSTPHIGPREQKPTVMNAPETSQHDVAQVSSAVGGSLSTLSFEETNRTSWRFPSTRRGGGTKGPVRGFSKSSRRNFLRRQASIDRHAFRASRGRMVFVMLTYPHPYPEDPVACKAHLKALAQGLEREYGSFAAFWRLGI